MFSKSFPFIHRRLANLLMALACTGLIIAALIFQYYDGEDPCPLCLIQRYFVIAMGVVFILLSIIHFKRNPAFPRIFSVVLLILAICGGASSVRHIYIQALPEDQVPTCTAPLDAMIDGMGYLETFKTVYLQGSGDCHDASWRFLGLTMPMWVLLWFIGLGLAGYLINGFINEKLFSKNFPFIHRSLANNLMALACTGLIIAALIFEHYDGEDPCPLCLIQRYFVISLGIVFFILSIIHFKKNRIFPRICSVVLIILAVCGGASSVRHIYIQALPEDQVPTCTAPLDAMIDGMGYLETFKTVYLQGSGDCHDASWRFLGLTMPMWVLLWFIGLGLAGFIINWFIKKQTSIFRD